MRWTRKCGAQEEQLAFAAQAVKASTGAAGNSALGGKSKTMVPLDKIVTQRSPWQTRGAFCEVSAAESDGPQWSRQWQGLSDVSAYAEVLSRLVANRNECP